MLYGRGSVLLWRTSAFMDWMTSNLPRICDAKSVQSKWLNGRRHGSDTATYTQTDTRGGSTGSKRSLISTAALLSICPALKIRSSRCSSLVTLARPSTYNFLRTTDRSFPYGINSRLLSVNHAPISPIPPSVPSTHHSHYPSLHSFIPGLQPSFSANPSHRSLPFLL